MNDNARVVCAWYTPDYAHWADALKVGLDRHGERHDIVEVEKMAGGWERNTMRKPGQILSAIRRHPGRVVIFLDVDCEVLEPLSELAKIKGDIAAYFTVDRRSRGYGRLFARSGTMVFRPTPIARAFVGEWASLSETSPSGWVDQHTLTEAIALTPGLSIEHLDVKWCAMAKDGVTFPSILHSGASRGAKKIPGWLRAINTFTHSCRR